MYLLVCQENHVYYRSQDCVSMLSLTFEVQVVEQHQDHIWVNAL